MKVFLAHNYYRSTAPSGEDAVFENERDMLLSSGIDIVSFVRHNDAIDESTLSKKTGLALAGAWSRHTYDDVSNLIKKTRPDVAHFHNTFPLISPSAYAACQDNDVPVVQTLHNYRLICPGALLQRNGHPCEKCVGTNLLPALRHRCYRHSLPSTGAVVWMLLYNRFRDSYNSLVNQYIALTRFSASRFRAGGLPADRIAVKSNFLLQAPAPGNGTGGYAVYVGRLSEEKGVRTLLTAWKMLDGIPLKILGDGPLFSELKKQAGSQTLPVEFMGQRTRKEVLEIVGRAALQIVPSEWYEGFPMVILEAYACGTPVIASSIGSLDEIVIQDLTGSKFTPGDAGDLANKVKALYSNSGNLEQLRISTRKYFDEHFSSDENAQQLINIYQNLINSKT